MNNAQLNSIALLAKGGDVEAMWSLKGYFHPFIIQLSDSCRNQMDSQEKFEDESFRIIEETVSRFDATLGNFRQLAVHSIKRRLGRRKRRYRNSLETWNVAFESIDGRFREQDDGFTECVIEDRLATVDERILLNELNEKIASLAGSDPRKLAIVNAWTKSDYTDSSIADLLAQTFGGKSESHRKFIARFKSQCKIALACAV
ncbi:hypothetical protein NYE48_28075 [Paenibacillus sp. FSL M7-1455]|uniref:hypothetical protein n=1 Tax=Paenibacillus sp. FSL M7-1455 TaxID=2975316 RepID=UPI0030F7408D